MNLGRIQIADVEQTPWRFRGFSPRGRRVEDAGECAHIIGNYATKVEAEEVRFARCGEHLWIRLERLQQEAVNLVLRVPVSSQFSAL